MTLKKKSLSREYDTFSSSSRPAHDSTKSSTDTSRRSVGLEAQRLASRGFWEDSPSHIDPPSTNSNMGAEEQAYPREEYPSDPPPIYTPSETTASTPPSPVISRSQPVSHPVGDPRPSPTEPTHPTIPEEAQEEQTTPESYTTSPLLERAQTEPECRPFRCGRWNNSDAHKQRRRRFRKACWFSFALALCLWMMLPALFSDKAGTRGPHFHHPPDGTDKSPLPAWPLPKREYRQHETSSSINGNFKLYDLLDLETTSGSININVEPQPGDKPAVMKIRTKSGSVRISMGKGILPWLPSSDATNRTFETSINTQSGSVSGSVVAGNGGLSTIETSSGSIKLTVHILDLGPKAQVSKLHTTSGSGSQGLTVVSSSAHDLRNLQAVHLVKSSASVRVDYPRRWVGKLHMQSLGSGSMKASGSGLEFQQDGNREKYAWRGDGDLNPVEIIVQGSGSGSFVC